ncbi:MAG: NosD domain-containing protein, partial [Candidatus Micrarchaeota archaeon]
MNATEGANIILDPLFVSVNDSSLTPMNRTAEITLETDAQCFNATIFRQAGFPQDRPTILNGSVIGISSCDSGLASFFVSSMAGYALNQSEQVRLVGTLLAYPAVASTSSTTPVSIGSNALFVTFPFPGLMTVQTTSRMLSGTTDNGHWGVFVNGILVSDNDSLQRFMTTPDSYGNTFYIFLYNFSSPGTYNISLAHWTEDGNMTMETSQSSIFIGSAGTEEGTSVDALIADVPASFDSTIYQPVALLPANRTRIEPLFTFIRNKMQANGTTLTSFFSRVEDNSTVFERGLSSGSFFSSAQNNFIHTAGEGNTFLTLYGKNNESGVNTTINATVLFFSLADNETQLVPHIQASNSSCASEAPCAIGNSWTLLSSRTLSTNFTNNGSIYAAASAALGASATNTTGLYKINITGTNCTSEAIPRTITGVVNVSFLTLQMMCPDLPGEGNYTVNLYAMSNTSGQNITQLDESLSAVAMQQLEAIQQSTCFAISSPGEYNMTENALGAPISASPLNDTACIKIASSDVLLDCMGFNITNNGTNGTTYGILLNGSLTNVTVRNCPRVSGYTHGVYIYQSNDSSIINVTARDGNLSGFTIFGGYNNIIENSTGQNFSHHVFAVTGGAGNNMTGNTALDTPDHGFHLQGTANNTLSGNIAANISDIGILLNLSDGNVIANNTANGNAESGFELNSSSFNVFTGNNASSNADAGFHLLFNSNFNNFSLNYAAGNAESNFEIHNLSNNNLFSNNTATGSTDAGYTLINVHNNSFTGNIAANNSVHGFVLSGSHDNNFTANSVSGNLRGFSLDGTLATGSLRNIFLGNNASDNFNTGIVVSTQSHDTIIVNNTLSDNSDNGISMNDVENGTISGNLISGNGNDGITVDNSSLNNISGNNITGNAANGLGFTNTSLSNSLLSNFVCSNGMDINNQGASNAGDQDRCDSFLNWSESSHLGCTYSCSTMWHRFFGDVNGTLILGHNQSPPYVYSWNASGFNVYFADIDTNVDWYSLQSIGLDTSNASSSSDFEELDIAFNTTGFSDNINATYSTDGSAPIQTDNYTVFLRPINNVPIANSTAFNTSFRTGILWDMSDGGTEYSNSFNQSTVWLVKVNASANDTYGTYDYLIQVPYAIADYEGNTSAVSIYLELK